MCAPCPSPPAPRDDYIRFGPHTAYHYCARVTNSTKADIEVGRP